MPKNITSVTWSATGLPAGLSINSATGVISGTPTVQPNENPGYPAMITVATNYGTDTKQITIKVAIPDTWRPLINLGQIINAIADTAITPYTVQGQNVEKTS